MKYITIETFLNTLEEIKPLREDKYPKKFKVCADLWIDIHNIAEGFNKDLKVTTLYGIPIEVDFKLINTFKIER